MERFTPATQSRDMDIQDTEKALSDKLNSTAGHPRRQITLDRSLIQYEIIGEPLFREKFSNLPLKMPFTGQRQHQQHRTGSALEEALVLSVHLDRAFEEQQREIMDLRQEMTKLVDRGQVHRALVLMQPSPNWRPKNYPRNFDQYENCVLELTGNALNRMGINAFNYINRMNREIASQTGDPRPRVCWMCCNEDANGAQIESILENIRHFHDLIRGTAAFTFNNKPYKLESSDIPPISFRPRGLHCVEAHVIDKANGEPIVGSFFDVALWAKFALPELLERGVCPLLYIPKMQVWQEARMWHQLLCKVEQLHGLQEGTIKTVFLCETFPAVFQLPRMIESFEGRLIGVNCGRWDYLFSYVQQMAEHTHLEDVDGKRINTVLPSKHAVTTDINLLKKYQIRTAQLCHHYGIMFIGGMNAQLPSTDPDMQKRKQENTRILAASTKDKSEERRFYGASKTWVAHIGLLEVAKTLLTVPHAAPIDKFIRDVRVSRSDLLHAPTVPDEVPQAYDIDTFRNDMYVVLLYMAMYLLNRNGAVAIDNKMEDLATAEISLSLLWFYVKHNLLSEDLKRAGGVDTVAEKVSAAVQQEVQFRIGPSHQLDTTPSAQQLERMMDTLRTVIVLVVKNRDQRPSLEKLLYVLGAKDDRYDRGRANEVMSRSKRFPAVADATRLTSSL